MISSVIVSDTSDGTLRAQTPSPARLFVDLSDSTITSFFSFWIVIDTQILNVMTLEMRCHPTISRTSPRAGSMAGPYEISVVNSNRLRWGP